MEFNLHKYIPGGAHTYSRGDDQYPSNAPKILERGKGAYVWDNNGNKFLDYGMGLRSVTLGYDYDSVSDAAIAEIRKGNNLTRASITEYKAAELIIDLFPWADMVKFAKNGSTVTTAAVKLSRAYTNRKYIAVCAEHPFFSFDDWFIGTTAVQKGIPEEIHSLTLKFNYNNISSLQKLFDQYPGQIACVLLEPATTISPCSEKRTDLYELSGRCMDKEKNFLHQVKQLCKKNGTVFILDEMITGFRFDLKGAMSYFNIEPDLATFGKGMANGFPLAALIGKKEIMNLGGILNEGSERVFLISTTHGSEMSSFGAFIETVKVYKEKNVCSHLWEYGKRLVDGANKIAESKNLSDYFSMEGYYCSPYYVTKDQSNQLSLEFRTLFSQEMIKSGVLIPWVALSLSHDQNELIHTLNAIEKSLDIYQKALTDGIDKYLVGNVIKPVFRKFN